MVILPLYNQVKKALSKSEFVSSDGEFLTGKIFEAIENLDKTFLSFFLKEKTTKEHFFDTIDDVFVLNQNKLFDFFNAKEYFDSSFTSYTPKIGLIRKDSFIKKFDDTVLAWPYKDCILEGGMSSEDAGKKEIFYNTIISKDEIDRLFEPKVLTNIRKYSCEGESVPSEITLDDNLILKGNNLLALYSLKKRYIEQNGGMIKLIYIDPPYNTGNDGFKYNDRFNHSTWLTFMKNRLEVARELLRDDGLIFVQCDYNESHYLKILMDEIFGKDKFINEVIWKRKFGNANETKRLGTAYDNIFIFSKTQNYQINLIREKDSKHVQDYIKARFTRKDESGKYKNKLWMPYPLANPGKPTENLIYEYKGYNPPEKGWRMVKAKLIELDNDDRLYFPKDKSQRIQEKKFLDEYEGQPVDSLWTDIFVINSQSGESIDFDGQKPEDLIKRILLIATNEDDIVLDYHLGSGTTAAVAHKMNRRYIGIEQMDYIETISVERLKKVIEGEQGGISKAAGWNGGGSFVYAELRETDDFNEADTIGRLNDNMRYLPISEIDDERYGVSDEEKRLNKQFYGIV